MHKSLSILFILFLFDGLVSTELKWNISVFGNTGWQIDKMHKILLSVVMHLYLEKSCGPEFGRTLHVNDS